MNSSTLCGAAVTEAGRMDWPFHRMVALGYYDGPTDGVVQCADCAEEYRFDLLDADWDGWMDVPRIFSLTPLPPGSLDRLVAICPQEEWAPDWSARPEWCPLWSFPLATEQEAANRQVQEILDLGTAPEWVVAWCEGDVHRLIVTARCLEQADRLYIRELLTLCPDGRPPLHPDPSKRRDWFAFLGIARPERGPDTGDEDNQ